MSMYEDCETPMTWGYWVECRHRRPDGKWNSWAHNPSRLGFFRTKAEAKKRRDEVLFSAKGYRLNSFQCRVFRTRDGMKS